MLGINHKNHKVLCMTSRQAYLITGLRKACQLPLCKFFKREIMARIKHLWNCAAMFQFLFSFLSFFLTLNPIKNMRA